jgi:hypothetical protein
MGYEEKARKIFSRAAFVVAAVSSASSGASGRGHAEGQDCSWDELNPISDFLQ